MQWWCEVYAGVSFQVGLPSNFFKNLTDASLAIPPYQRSLLSCRFSFAAAVKRSLPALADQRERKCYHQPHETRSACDGRDGRDTSTWHSPSTYLCPTSWRFSRKARRLLEILGCGTDSRAYRQSRPLGPPRHDIAPMQHLNLPSGDQRHGPISRMLIMSARTRRYKTFWQ